MHKQVALTIVVQVKSFNYHAYNYPATYWCDQYYKIHMHLSWKKMKGYLVY